ncbi:MAG: PEP-CTERM sorting domain-containing protein [Planctomycetales bacterium]|nr:PEP-CTERM sorting domain-containing protein [Planctomycetales bacterium]
MPLHAVEIVGYLPDYRFKEPYYSSVLPEQLPLLDEVRYFGMTIAADGSLNVTASHEANLTKLARTIQSQPGIAQPRVVLTLGGGGGNMSDNFAIVAGNSAKRKVFAANIRDFIESHDLAGVNLDWEAPSTESERANYVSLLKDIKHAVGSKLVTIAIAPSLLLPNQVVSGDDGIDGVDLMTYGLGWWGNDPRLPTVGEHSPQSFVEEAVNAWTQPLGTRQPRTWVFGSKTSVELPPDKLGVGLPFYGLGYDGTDRGSARTYANLLNNGTTSDGQRFELGGEHYWIPSLDDVRQRVAYADEQGIARIIVWEISQDVPPSDSRSMLRATAVPEPTTTTLLATGMLFIIASRRRRP